MREREARVSDLDWDGECGGEFGEGYETIVGETCSGYQ